MKRTLFILFLCNTLISYAQKNETHHGISRIRTKTLGVSFSSVNQFNTSVPASQGANSILLSYGVFHRSDRMNGIRMSIASGYSNSRGFRERLLSLGGGIFTRQYNFLNSKETNGRFGYFLEESLNGYHNLPARRRAPSSQINLSLQPGIYGIVGDRLAIELYVGYAFVNYYTANGGVFAFGGNSNLAYTSLTFRYYFFPLNKAQ